MQAACICTLCVWFAVAFFTCSTNVKLPILGPGPGGNTKSSLSLRSGPTLSAIDGEIQARSAKVVAEEIYVNTGCSMKVQTPPAGRGQVTFQLGSRGPVATV